MNTKLATTVSALALLLSVSVAWAIDDCATAVPFGGPDSSFPGFNLSPFTDSVGDPIRSCTSEPGHNNIWGTFTPTTNGILYVTGDGNVSVYSGTCGALTEVLCHLPNGTDSALLTGGQTYYLELSSPPTTISYAAVYCGDGNPTNQACDDGNLIDTDSCTNECAFNVCGDSSLYLSVEECDDGNLDDTDACTADCTVALCGDGSLRSGFEECDDGNLANGDGCQSDCTILPVCGNGIPEGTEECDDGNSANTDACTNGCLVNVCGDGFTNTGVEQCDDGNLIDGDGCDSDCGPATNDKCTYATVLTLPANENVNLTDATTSPSDPMRSCTGQQGAHNRWFAVTPSVSGLLQLNAFVQTSVYAGTCGALVEVACHATPALVSVSVTAGQTYYLEVAGAEGFPFPLSVGICGDALPGPFEQCDDGNAVDTDACSNTCRLAVCGDGTVQTGEQCDDSNLTNGDGCEDDCFVTSVCGDGTSAGHESCDDGNLIDGDGCDADCRLPCPDNLCKCLGAAQQFTVVGAKLGIANGKISGGGLPTEFFPSEIEGSVCGTAATFTAKPAGETDLMGDLVLTADGGNAGNFKSYKENGVPQPGTFILGDLATGGGLVKGAGLTVAVDGITDTTGNHPLFAPCAQAALDVANASMTLAGLTPTQSFAEIALESGDEQTTNVGPGRQVVSIGVLQLQGSTSDLGAAVLTFQMQPTTEVLIINVTKLFLGPGAEILIDDAGSGAYAIVNVAPGGKVTLKDDAAIDASLLAPTANIVLHGAFVGGVYTTKGVKLQGATLSSALECGE